MSDAAALSAEWLAELTGIALPAEAENEPDTLAVPDTATAEVAEVLRRRLAIRGRIRPVALLPRDLAHRALDAVLALVAPDCDTGIGSGGWILRDAPRRRVLHGLGRDGLATLLMADPAQGDELWDTLYLLAGEEPPPLGRMSRAELAALLEALEWTGLPAPPAVSVRLHLARRRRREELSVPQGFVGRARERAVLESFLAAPASAAGCGCAIRSLMLWGMGGQGKSSLLAAVLGAMLDDDPGLALAHLDFDRPGLDPLAPATLDLEVLRQSALCDEAMDGPMRELRRELRLALEATDAATEAANTAAHATMTDSLAWLRERGRPLVLVLDTLERIQDRGPGARRRLIEWLGRLAGGAGLGELRILASGRDEPWSWLTPRPKGGNVLAIPEAIEAGDATSLLPIKDLTPEDAEAMLRSRGVGEAAQRLAAAFGGNPLVLAVVADLARRGDPLELPDGDVPRAVVHAYLFDRTLRHIGDEEAEAYAHLALFLPEVTPEAIAGILAPVLNRPEPDPARAEEIFERLAAVSWLVRREQRTIRMREDVRELLIRLLTHDAEQRALGRRVHEQAARWHRDRPGGVHAALAIFHAATLDSHDLPDELPEAARPYLGSYVAALGEPARTVIGMWLNDPEIDPAHAAAVLPDAHWARFLEKGAASLTRGLAPRELLGLWRHRPVPGQLPPAAVLEALAEAADWDDPAADPAALVAAWQAGATYRRPAMTPVPALHWLVTLALLRPPHRLPPALVYGPEQYQDILPPALLALAELLSGGIFLSDLSPRRVLPLEPRVLLAHSRRAAPPDWAVSVPLGALAVAQRDWVARHGPALTRLGAEPAALAAAQAELDGLAGGRLADFGKTVRGISLKQVKLRVAAGDPRWLGRLLRGTLPELHRPARDALLEALPHEPSSGVLARLRSYLSLWPAELEPERMMSRLRRDPPGTWLLVVQFADQARVLGTLLRLAGEAAPGAMRLARVRATLTAWEARIGSDDWDALEH